MGVSPKSDGGAFIPFPVDVLPDPIRGFVVEGAKSIGCDASFVALPLLSALAGAIGNTYQIATKGDWTEPAILWTVIVGDSGSAKSPAFSFAVSFMHKLQDRAFKEHQEVSAKWQEENLRYEADLNDWKKEKSKRRNPPPQKPEQPIARRYVVEDPTVESLAPMLRDNPRGVLLARDELSGWLGSFDRYTKGGKGGADLAHWLSMHKGESMTIDRKTGIPPTIRVLSASVSIAGGIQPGVLTRAMGREHRESGMLARFMLAMPPRRPKKWIESSVDAGTKADVAAVFESLLGLTMAIGDKGELKPNRVTLSKEAKQSFIEFVNEHGQEQYELDDADLRSAWAKLEGYAARLALVIHMARWASGNESVPDPTTPVDETSIAAGIRLSRWFCNEAKRVYAVMEESEEDRKKRELIEWIRNRGGACSVNDLVHDKREYRHNRNRAEADLMELVKRRAGEWDKGQKNGRPSQLFRLFSDNPVTESTESSAKVDSLGDSDTSEWSDDEGGEV